MGGHARARRRGRAGAGHHRLRAPVRRRGGDGGAHGARTGGFRAERAGRDRRQPRRRLGAGPPWGRDAGPVARRRRRRHPPGRPCDAGARAVPRDAAAGRLGAAMATESKAERGEQMDRILGLSGGAEGAGGGVGSPALEPAVKPGKVLTASEREAKAQEKMQQAKERERRQSVHMEKVEALRPAIDHDAPATVVLGDDYKVVAEIPGSGMYDSVQAWYRPVGQSEWSRAGLRKVGDGYEGSISTTRLFVDGLEYWIEARPYTEGMPTLKVGSASQPIRVDVVID